MAKVSVNSSQNKCCHLKCGNQACKRKERNVTCNPSGSVNKLGSCFRFLSDKTTYLTVWKVISSCWNSGKSTEGFFAILQLLFKLLVESLFQFLELSNFICLAHEHAQSALHCGAGTGRTNHLDLTGANKPNWKHNELLHSSQDVFVRMQNSLCDRITFLIKAHPADPRAKPQAFSLVPLRRRSLRERLCIRCFATRRRV